MSPATRERLRALLAREVAWSAVRAQGAGGQNVNKVSSAVHLRFDVHASALPAAHKARLLALRDQLAQPPRARIATKPTRASKQRRLEGKSVRSEVKRGRGKVAPD